jgi:hypothetical protein
MVLGKTAIGVLVGMAAIGIDVRAWCADRSATCQDTLELLRKSSPFHLSCNELKRRADGLARCSPADGDDVNFKIEAVRAAQDWRGCNCKGDRKPANIAADLSRLGPDSSLQDFSRIRISLAKAHRCSADDPSAQEELRATDIALDTLLKTSRQCQELDADIASQKELLTTDGARSAESVRSALYTLARCGGNAEQKSAVASLLKSIPARLGGPDVEPLSCASVEQLAEKLRGCRKDQSCSDQARSALEEELQVMLVVHIIESTRATASADSKDCTKKLIKALAEGLPLGEHSSEELLKAANLQWIIGDEHIRGLLADIARGLTDNPEVAKELVDQIKQGESIDKILGTAARLRKRDQDEFFAMVGALGQLNANLRMSQQFERANATMDVLLPAPAKETCALKDFTGTLEGAMEGWTKVSFYADETDLENKTKAAVARRLSACASQAGSTVGQLGCGAVLAVRMRTDSEGYASGEAKLVFIMAKDSQPLQMVDPLPIARFRTKCSTDSQESSTAASLLYRLNFIVAKRQEQPVAIARVADTGGCGVALLPPESRLRPVDDVRSIVTRRLPPGMPELLSIEKGAGEALQNLHLAASPGSPGPAELRLKKQEAKNGEKGDGVAYVADLAAPSDGRIVASYKVLVPKGEHQDDKACLEAAGSLLGVQAALDAAATMKIVAQRETKRWWLIGLLAADFAMIASGSILVGSAVNTANDSQPAGIDSNRANERLYGGYALFGAALVSTLAVGLLSFDF